MKNAERLVRTFKYIQCYYSIALDKFYSTGFILFKYIQCYYSIYRRIKNTLKRRLFKYIQCYYSIEILSTNFITEN